MAMSAPYEGDSAAKGTHGLTGKNTKGGDGVWGESDPVAGRGVVGVSDAGTGVWGETNSGRAVVGVVRTQGDAVWGETKAGRGVVGVCQGQDQGVWGTSEKGDGVHGETNSFTWSAGVSGFAINPRRLVPASSAEAT